MCVDMFIFLKGKTQHGKNRIREHGNKWEVLDHTSPLRLGQMFIRSAQTGDKRWLTEDFEMLQNDCNKT